MTYTESEQSNIVPVNAMFEAGRSAGKVQYLTEHWNTWYAHRVLFDNFPVEPAHPLP